MNMVAHTFAFLLLASLARQGNAEVPLFDVKQPQGVGGVLVGMECNAQTRTLELGITFPYNPRPKLKELWRTRDLVKFDPTTFMVEEILFVERQCKLGSDNYRIRLEGIPGAANAMWMCGADTGVNAKVWINDKLNYDEDLHRCEPRRYVTSATFTSPD